MARVTHLVDQVYRYTESVAPTQSVDIHIYNRVTGADNAARILAATNLAGGNGSGQLQAMDPASPNARGSNCVLISSTVTAL